MVNEKMRRLGANRSVIRDLFEYANARRKEIGAENVFDFSLGNPSVPTHEDVTARMISLLQNQPPASLHGYTSAPGAAEVRQAIAAYIANAYSAECSPELIYLTCGAAAALVCALSALLCAEDEAVVFAPFFPEYRVFIENTGAKLVCVPCKEPDFSIDFTSFSKAVTNKTRVVIVNSPNNPTGKVITEEELKTLCAILKQKEREYGAPIYLISDEPYREIVYGNVFVPYVPRYYNNAAVCYSFSKSLSLPGERIGYISVSPRAQNAAAVFEAICGAGRAHGYVCAPSLLQFTVAECLGKTADFSSYKINRDLLYSYLCETGYDCVRPDGAFYLFVKALEKDAKAFSERAKKYELILVPSDDFYYPGYVRISYCVPIDTVRRSLPAFKALMEDYAREKR
ncbi:MAG: pyridoxal phosphate-dependent aminotransferase [Candidatus Borkfalkiaceae bacterium]|nr:pyridoxal phosphate-dependent aminotransferase [Clostridia bacterium]MDY6223284.1 pyridoxal phosphate-dependent aminotransferase [Christensenellaceae bacterium]